MSWTIAIPWDGEGFGGAVGRCHAAAVTRGLPALHCSDGFLRTVMTAKPAHHRKIKQVAATHT
jgi:hypothetical protein